MNNSGNSSCWGGRLGFLERKSYFLGGFHLCVEKAELFYAFIFPLW